MTDASLPMLFIVRDKCCQICVACKLALVFACGAYRPSAMIELNIYGDESVESYMKVGCETINGAVGT